MQVQTHEIWNLIDTPGSMERIRAGDQFVETVMQRYECRRKERYHLNRMIGEHAGAFLLGLAILINLISIGVGLHSLQHPNTVSTRQITSGTSVYFLDVSTYHVSNYIQ